MTHPFTAKIHLRFRDIDAMGHVNNAVFVTFLETTRVAYWRARWGEESTRDWGVIMGEVHLRYLAPIELQEEDILVNFGCSRIGNKSFDFAYELTSLDGSRIFAKARTVQVGYDYQAKQSQPLPEKMVETLKADFWQPEGLP